MEVMEPRKQSRWVICGVAAVVAAAWLPVVAGRRAAEKLPGDLASCLSEAKNANAAHDIKLERRVLEHAETLQGDARDAAEVQRSLAVLDWKYHHRFDEARSRLLRAAESGSEPARAWIALSRMEQARGDHAAAREAAARALEVAGKDLERRNARLVRARASVGEAEALRRGGKVGDTDALRVAFDDLHGRVTEEPGELQAPHLLLGAALILDRGDAALLAWRSYYHVAPGRPAPNVIAGAGEDLNRILPGWRGAGASPKERIDLVKALADTRFFEEAALVALDPRADASVRENPRVREVTAYAEAIRRVREVTEEHYRRTILGDADPNGFKDQVKAQAAPVLAAMGVDLQNPPSDEELEKLFDTHFGAFIMIGLTAGYEDLHMGHRILDETRTVKQYGHEADVRFVVLDSMVSNGFQSWAWESGGQHGGWVEHDAIWQVRPAYADTAIDLWRRLHSEEAMAEFSEQLARETALDEERARKDPYAYLPGLGLRLRKQAVKAIEDRLRQQGLEGDALRLAFLAEFDRSRDKSSIFAHEGRHAIDLSVRPNLNGRKLEYYAKLSEVAFSTDPRLSVLAVFDSAIGDPTSHGQADLRIVKNVVKWMKKHHEEIRGLDRARPLLPQFDLLSDEQIRGLFRSMDPLAKRAPQENGATVARGIALVGPVGAVCSSTLKES